MPKYWIKFNTNEERENLFKFLIGYGFTICKYEAWVAKDPIKLSKQFSVDDKCRIIFNRHFNLGLIDTDDGDLDIARSLYVVNRKWIKPKEISRNEGMAFWMKIVREFQKDAIVRPEYAKYVEES